MPTEEEILQSLQPAPSTARLHAVAEKAHELLNLDLDIADLEERLKEANAKRETIIHEQLPELMDQAGTDRIGIPAQGNQPAYDAKLSPYYAANISTKWPAPRRQAAFDELTNLGHQDLIKTEISISIPREERDKVAQLKQKLNDLGYAPEIKESVHHMTLTAWLKEQVERGNPLPNLETIGAYIGRVVKLTKRT